MLSSLVPEIEAKDASKWCFPGDHGFVLISLALYVSYLGARDTAKWTWLACFIFILPRLIAGAHWPSDVIVGSGTMALAAMAFLMGTPLHDSILRWAERYPGHTFKKPTFRRAVSKPAAA